MNNISLDARELRDLLNRLDRADGNFKRIALNAIDAGVKPMKRQLEKDTPRSKTIRQSSVRETWRTGKHAADDIRVTDLKTSKAGGVYKVVGTDPSDNSPHFYIKFFETGRRIYNVRNWRWKRRWRMRKRRAPEEFLHSQSARPFTEKSAEAARDAVREAMRESLINDMGL